MAILHVADVDGNRLQGATIVVEQISRDFPFGSAIAQTILGNLPYQVSTLYKIQNSLEASLPKNTVWKLTNILEAKSNFNIFGRNGSLRGSMLRCLKMN